MNKTLLTSMAAVVVVGWTAVGRAQENFPDRPLIIVVPTSPGGGNDVVARQIAPFWEEELGVPVVIDNRPGAALTNGCRHFVKQPADGYTVFMSATSLTATPVLTGVKECDHTQWRGIGAMGRDVVGVAVAASSPYQTFPDLMEALLADKATAGVPGGASAANMIFSQIKAAKGDFTIVPFEGSSDALTAVRGGHVDAGVHEPSEIWSLLEAGQMRFLAIAAAERLPFLPDVPTLRETGVDVVFEQFRGFLALKDVPDERAAILEAALEVAYNRPEWQQYLDEKHMIKEYWDAAEFDRQVAVYSESLGALLRSMGLEAK